MLSNDAKRFVTMIQKELPSRASITRAAEGVREGIESLMGPMPPHLLQALEEARAYLEESYGRIEVLRKNSLTKQRDSWYHGPTVADKHWPALQSYLTSEKDWSEETVASIDETSDEIVSLLANPAQDRFRCRGLVVGHVQSGKTANMTAVIAKAVDAGYNLIIILGGITNKLRAQTQRRIDADIVMRHREVWQLYTTEDENGDFNFPANRAFTMPSPGQAQLIVMKKIASRLENLRRTIDRTSQAVSRKLKVLLIDDECDQASVNSAGNEFDMTVINAKIRKILGSLPAVSYVGYTATPFANVFINPFPENSESLDDLYPEDFITALPKSKDYFGALEVFGRDPLDIDAETEEEAGRDMVRVVPEAETKLLRPTGAAAQRAFQPEVTRELENALQWFLASCCARLARGQSESHMTMLVHTSPNIAQHERMASAITAWLGQFRAIATHDPEQAAASIRDIWVSESDRARKEADPKTEIQQLLAYLPEVVTRVQVVVENSVSAERIDYTQEPKLLVVVGGSVLARGLTLEGLTVSFFLRTSRQYDSLLQMGRWFGYRHGYEDLPRLWTTSDLADDFRSLARIEEEIRDDIAVYRSSDSTPLDVAVKVRSIPGMAITSATKMKHAVRTSVSFSGRHIQTIRFNHQIASAVDGNWEAASNLVTSISAVGQPAQFGDGRIVYRDVPQKFIRRFLADYDLCEAHMDLKKTMLLDYIDGLSADSPVLWNVGIVTPASQAKTAKALGTLGRVPVNNRAKLRSGTSYADIKALMSVRDILADSDLKHLEKGSGWDVAKLSRPAVPLLLVYPIDRVSVPKHQSKAREPLDALGDLVGFGIVFPGARDRSGNYYSVQLEVPTPEDVEGEELATIAEEMLDEL